MIVFGKGTILAIEGSGENAKAEVEFQAVGRKKTITQVCSFQSARLAFGHTNENE